jgi:hypothetical protein
MSNKRPADGKVVAGTSPENMSVMWYRRFQMCVDRRDPMYIRGHVGCTLKVWKEGEDYLAECMTHGLHQTFTKVTRVLPYYHFLTKYRGLTGEPIPQP